MKSRNTFYCFIFFFFLIQFTAFSQTQLGNDIDGEEALEQSGSALDCSANGDRVVIGARFNDEAGDGAGKVRVYDWNGTDWVQITNGITGESQGENFGYAVSISADGNRIAAGASNYGPFIGQVRIYEWNGSGWGQLGQSITGEDAFESSGYSISLSADGSTVAIGAPFNNDGESSAGQVRAYSWDGTQWLKRGDDIEGLLEGDLTGWSVALSADGNRLTVGEPSSGVVMNTNGRVRIFDWNGDDWINIGTITGMEWLDRFGESVSFSDDGKVIAIGAASTNGSEGYARIYRYEGLDWVPLGEKIKGENPGDGYGKSISINSSGDRIAIGTPFHDGNGSLSGHVRVFDWNGTAWEQLGTDLIGENPGDYSGSAIALSGDGHRIAIGGWNNDDNGENAGHVRVFELETITAVENTSLTDFAIFPNPTAGIIEIRGVKEGILRIQDCKGRVWQKYSVPITQVNLASLPDGIYALTLYTSKGIFTKKVIKQ